MGDQVEVVWPDIFGGAVKNFVAGITKAHGKGAHLTLEIDAHADDQLDIGLALAHFGVVPEQAHAPDRDSGNAQPVHRGGGPFFC